MNHTREYPETKRMALKISGVSPNKNVDETYAVVAAVMPGAVADAQQSDDPAVAQKAWEFLNICAPIKAAELRHRRQKANKGV